MAHVPAPAGRTLSLSIIRSEYAELDPDHIPERLAEFDQWRRHHDECVRTVTLYDVEKARTAKGAVVSQAGLIRMLEDLGIVVDRNS